MRIFGPAFQQFAVISQRSMMGTARMRAAKKAPARVPRGRYFQLFGDRLDYFAHEADANSGADPRGRLNFADVVDFEAPAADAAHHVVLGTAHRGGPGTGGANSANRRSLM